MFPYFNVGNGYSGLGSTGYVPLEENPSAFDFNPSVVKTIHGHSITVGGSGVRSSRTSINMASPLASSPSARIGRKR